VAPPEIFLPARSVALVEGWDGRRPENAMGALMVSKNCAILIDRGSQGDLGAQCAPTSSAMMATGTDVDEVSRP
jgi:hypothetical protein